VPDQFSEAEAKLPAIVQDLTVTDTRRALGYWRQSVDGPGTHLTEIEEEEMRGISVSPTLDGMVRIDGWMTRPAGQTLLSALNALMPPPGGDDTRTLRQRRHDALEDLACHYLEDPDTPTVGGEKPHVNLVCDLPALQGIPGGLHQTESGQLLTIAQLRTITCDCSLSRIILGPDSEIIDVGRRTRIIPTPHHLRTNPCVQLTGGSSTSTTSNTGQTEAPPNPPTFASSAAATTPESTERPNQAVIHLTSASLSLPHHDHHPLPMSLGFGLLSAQLRPGETDWSRAYEETIRLAVEAERLGLSSVWTTEHHFVDDGYMPSLAVVSGAIAAATSTIEIGTGVILAPLHHPLRLAEDAATASLLSGGRFTLGLGLGWIPIEFEGLAADMGQRGQAMEETLTILRKAWTGEPFRHQGKGYDLPELAVRPAPSSSIPILIGGGAEPAIRRAARLADGIFSNVSPDKFLEQVGWLTNECDRIGRDPNELRVVHYSVIIPGETAHVAWMRYADDVWHMTWKYSDMEASATRPGPPPSPPDLTEENRQSLHRRFTIAGPSDEIVSTLLQVRKRAGIEVEFVARSYFAALEYEAQVELMQQLAEEVAPHL